MLTALVPAEPVTTLIWGGVPDAPAGAVTNAVEERAVTATIPAVAHRRQRAGRSRAPPFDVVAISY
jgi:hypothetical protein